MTHPSHPARRRLGALLGAGVVLLTACQNAGTATPAPSATPSAVRHSSGSPSVAATAAGLTAQQRLDLIASTINATAADHTAELPYTYLHLQTWARASNTIVRTDVRRWRHDTDSSGRELVRRAPDMRGVNQQPTPEDRRALSRAAPRSLQYPAGRLPPYLPGGVPAHPGELATLLASPRLAAEPAYPRMLTGGVVALATSYHLDTRQRATALRVLAAVPTITYEGPTADLAGRAGLAFEVIADGTTSTLVIDRATGELLAAKEWVDGGRRPGLFSYTLILERGRTSNTDTPTSPTTAAVTHLR